MPFGTGSAQGVLGAPTTPATASVTASSTQAVAANARRTHLVIVNLGTVSVSFGIGQAAVLGAGITLTANGGTWVMSVRTFSTAAINAICASTSTLSIQEYQQ